MKRLRQFFAHENTHHAIKWILILDAVAIVVVGALVWQYDVLGYRADLAAQAGAKHPLLSRQVLEYAESVVRETKPAPAEAAREYAYVASAYQGVFESDGQAAALAGTQVVLEALYPDRKSATRTQIDGLYKQAGLTRPAGDGSQYTAVRQLTKRMASDGHALVWDGVIPSGSGKWVKTVKDPFTPRAGEWQRWQVSGNFDVPAPPQYGSDADAQELAKVRTASAARDGAWVAKINFWGGTPGTNSPSGIWQDQFYKTVTPDIAGTWQQRDRSYAYAQKVLAQTLADAFIECWKVKYTYWTARPDMRDAGIKTSMPDPMFPGYVSGHSTVSKAAAEVLAVMAPAHADEWRQMAVDAKDSRLYAGIHFDNDNVQGFRLGQSVAQQVIVKRSLTRVY